MQEHDIFVGVLELRANGMTEEALRQFERKFGDEYDQLTETRLKSWDDRKQRLTRKRAQLQCETLEDETTKKAKTEHSEAKETSESSNSSEQSEDQKQVMTRTIPVTSILEDVAAYIIMNEPIVKEAIYVRFFEETITIAMGDLVFLEFSKVPNGCKLGTEQGIEEFHRNNFIDLALTTFMRMLTSKELETKVIVFKLPDEPTTEGDRTWIKFMKSLYSLRSVINQANLWAVFAQVTRQEDYTVMRSFMEFSSPYCLCSFPEGVIGEPHVAHIERVDEEEARVGSLADFLVFQIIFDD